MNELVNCMISAPERGPDFWRVLQENPRLNQTNVTLLFLVGVPFLRRFFSKAGHRPGAALLHCVCNSVWSVQYICSSLLFPQPSQREHPLCCVEGLVVQHQTSRGAVWSENVGQVSNYTFSWTEDAHTVTVLASNALGSSSRNSKMILIRCTKREQFTLILTQWFTG